MSEENELSELSQAGTFYMRYCDGDPNALREAALASQSIQNNGQPFEPASPAQGDLAFYREGDEVMLEFDDRSKLSISIVAKDDKSTQYWVEVDGTTLPAIALRLLGATVTA